MILIMNAFNFLSQKKIIEKLKRKIIFILIYFVMKMIFEKSEKFQKFEKCIDSLLITKENKSHYVFIKDFNRFMCNKKKK